MAIIPSSATEPPQHARAAPSHPDPYPYYGLLAREQPFFRDEENGWWVAASAAAVKEVLTSDLCLTRPLSEPIPAALCNGAAAEIFGRLVRLRDDKAGGRMRQAVDVALRGLDPAKVAALTRTEAAQLDADLGLPLDETKTTQFMFALPVRVIARLLGVPRERFSDIMAWLGDYGVAAAAAGTGIPAPNAALFERAHRAARALLDLVGWLKDDHAARGPLLDALVLEAQRAGCDDKGEIVANAIGYMIQGYAAIASLIGATLLALSRHPAVCKQVHSDHTLLRPLIQEVLRCDPSTNSTFRFMARDGVVAGLTLRKGDMIIVLIAAANRDPALNPEPDRFDIARPDRKYLEFGIGRHSCPANKFAPLIAEIAVHHLLACDIPLERLEASLSYAASGHIRTPLFKR